MAKLNFPRKNFLGITLLLCTTMLISSKISEIIGCLTKIRYCYLQKMEAYMLLHGVSLKYFTKTVVKTPSISAKSPTHNYN